VSAIQVLRQMPAVRKPASRNSSAASVARSGSASASRSTPVRAGCTPVQSEAIEGLVQLDWLWTAAKRIPPRASASSAGDVGRA
jgi:hypothetical protein